MTNTNIFREHLQKAILNKDNNNNNNNHENDNTRDNANAKNNPRYL